MPSRPPTVREQFLSLPAYAAGEPASLAATHKLSSNENPEPPLPAVGAALAEAARRINRYPDLANSALVGALARRLSVPPERLFVSPGATPLLDQLVRLTTAPGEEVVTGWPSFEGYPLAIRANGARTVTVPLRRAALDLPAMAAAITPRTRLVFVCSPNNPTGTTVTHDRLAAFLERVPERVHVVLDEAYIDYVDDPAAPRAVELVAEHPGLTVVRTFSKAHGLAGLRVGYAVTHPAMVDALTRLRPAFGVTALAEAAAVASLRAEYELADRMERARGERDRLVAGLRAAGWQVPPSQANFVWLPPGPRTRELAARLRANGLTTRLLGEDGLRISLGTPGINDLVLHTASEDAPTGPVRGGMPV
ncbi:histidinol phosphate aminotransferase apoenzyme [Streptomyces zhaozhouensis]|uniref:Histidinol-phosphate aminotransferase n=1 Tax=Streptomyces zhaozhouensis TaxID=1300267 RepID=A0A286DUF4_9ACTN|nr:histidinol-phosphate transaminase [Streptomyces zhaozhouensis]SOD62296.1 histidinol phosphate aminotransferase apoenzyme [Streptomyces zhaozhouensis]